jgi:chemotaxis protein histidine kinase CheA
MDSNYDPNNPEDRLKLAVVLDTLARATGVANDAIHDMREMVVRRMKRIINNAKKP